MSRIITATVFDVDNTLVDFYTMKKHCVDAGLDKMIARGLPITKDEGKKIIEDIFINEGWEDPLLFWHAAQYCGIKNDVTIERFAQIGKTAYRLRQREFLKPYDGIRETLDALREQKIQTAILSDAPRLKVFDRLCDTDLDHYFEDRVVGNNNEPKNKKPSAVAFQRVLAVLGRDSPEGVLMVGDQPIRDVLGAKNYGFMTAWAKYGYLPKQGEDINKVTVRADYVLEKPTDLIDIVKKAA